MAYSKETLVYTFSTNFYHPVVMLLLMFLDKNKKERLRSYVRLPNIYVLFANEFKEAPHHQRVKKFDKCRRVFSTKYGTPYLTHCKRMRIGGLCSFILYLSDSLAIHPIEKKWRLVHLRIILYVRKLTKSNNKKKRHRKVLKPPNLTHTDTAFSVRAFIGCVRFPRYCG